MSRKRLGGDGLDELLGASERVRKAPIASGRVVRARAKILARHKPPRVRKPAGSNTPKGREGGYEVRKARLNLVRRTIPMLIILALLMARDGEPGRHALPADPVPATGEQPDIGEAEY